MIGYDDLVFNRRKFQQAVLVFLAIDALVKQYTVHFKFNVFLYCPAE